MCLVFNFCFLLPFLSLFVNMSKLVDLIQLQDYITEVTKENSSKLTLWIMSLSFTEDEQRFLAEEFSFISQIRPNSLDIYASLIYNMSTNDNYKYFMPVLIENLISSQQYIFLRKLLICGAIVFNQISDKIPQDDFLIFAPEFDLLDNYSDYEADFEMGFPFDSLGFATKYDHVENMMNYLKDKNIDTISVDWCKFEPTKPHKTMNPLSTAAIFGAEKCFDKLIQLNAKITDHVYECAVIGGNYSIIQKLNLQSHLNSEIIDLILKYRRGRLLNQLYSLSLAQCIKNRCYSAATFAYSLDESSINKLDEESGFSPLHYATQINCIGLVRFLITNECNINIKSKGNQTALHIACKNSNESIIDLLISNGATLENQNNDGDTPLHFISRMNNNKLAKFIYEHYEDKEQLKKVVKLQNKIGLSPIKIAQDNKNFELFGLFSMI